MNTEIDEIKKNIVEEIDSVYRKGYQKCQRDTKEHGDKAYQQGYEDGARCQDEVQYQHGYEDAWDMLKYICSGGRERLLKVFGTISITQIISDNTASEAKAKIDAWGQKKQQDNEIKVGDEVECNAFGRGVVLNKHDMVNEIDVLIDDGSVFDRVDLRGMTKTGRHFDGIAEVLKQMQE